MLRILADENLPGPVIRLLRERGHIVRWVIFLNSPFSTRYFPFRPTAAAPD